MSARSEPPILETVDVDGERLQTAWRPGVGTPLVFCNDFIANLAVLDDVVAAFDRPTLCFDLPGIGDSGDLQRMRRMPALARLLAGLLDAMAIEQPVDLLGIGWGGLLAQRFACDEPRRIRRLVLVATSSGQLMFPGRVASLLSLARPAALREVAPDGAGARQVFGGRRDDECDAIAAAFARATAPSRRGYAGQLYALAGYSSLAFLHRLDVPTLILAGDDDAISPTVNARMMAFLLPRARLEIVRGGGHWVMLERTAEVVRHIEAFLGARQAIAGALPNDPLE